MDHNRPILTEGLVVSDFGEEMVVYHPESGQVYHLNRTAALAMRGEREAFRETPKLWDYTLEELARRGLVRGPERRLGRRPVLAAALLPVIVVAVAGEPVSAVSCVALGNSGCPSLPCCQELSSIVCEDGKCCQPDGEAPCGDDSDCCSGECVGTRCCCRCGSTGDNSCPDEDCAVCGCPCNPDVTNCGDFCRQCFRLNGTEVNSSRHWCLPEGEGANYFSYNSCLVAFLSSLFSSPRKPFYCCCPEGGVTSSSVAARGTAVANSEALQMEQIRAEHKDELVEPKPGEVPSP